MIRCIFWRIWLGIDQNLVKQSISSFILIFYFIIIFYFILIILILYSQAFLNHINHHEIPIPLIMLNSLNIHKTQVLNLLLINFQVKRYLIINLIWRPSYIIPLIESIFHDNKDLNHLKPIVHHKIVDQFYLNNILLKKVYPLTLVLIRWDFTDINVMSLMLYKFVLCDYDDLIWLVYCWIDVYYFCASRYLEF